MKKLFYTIILLVILGLLQGCALKNERTDSSPPSETFETNTSKSKITEEMAYEGVYNYCHSAYDWSVAEDNPSIMYLEMGEASETEYQVVFRSYTGAYVYFYVDKSTGATRMIEYVPTLNLENEAGEMDLYDYLPKEHD